ncbi:MAG: hypothetical protein ACI90V_005700 [Bacillariaceae sp.]|jgi:hypothetical protein
MSSTVTSSDRKPLVMADPAKGTKMDASIVAKSFRNEIKAKVVDMKQAGIGTLKMKMKMFRFLVVTS